MKTIDEIERISFEDLERVADDAGVKAPRDLSDSIARAVTAAETLNVKRRKAVSYTVYGILGAALASLVIVLSLPQQPRDTFDDPALAYAEIEKAFQLMSGKMEKGFQIASEATPIIEMTNEVYK